MKWVVLALGLLAVIVAAAVVAWHRSETRWAGQDLLGRRTTDPGRPSPARCLPCLGTGSLDREPERTLNVVGAGFEDGARPVIPCSACRGTGTAPARR